MEQKDGAFIPHELLTDMPQAGVHIVDVNSDGQNEFLVGSYENNVVFLFSKGE